MATFGRTVVAEEMIAIAHSCEQADLERDARLGHSARTSSADSWYQAALFFDSQNPQALQELSCSHELAGKNALALEELQRAIASHRLSALDEARCHSRKGHVLLSTQSAYSKAIPEYTAAIALDPTSAWDRLIRAECYANTGKFQEAIGDATATIALDESLTGAYTVRGDCYAKVDKLNLALQDYTQVIQRGGSYADYEKRAEVYAELGKRLLAIDDLRTALNLASDSRMAKGGISEANMDRVTDIENRLKALTIIDRS